MGASRKARPVAHAAIIAAMAALFGAGSVAAAVPPASGPRVCPAVAVDPFELYGDRISFRVLRNGSPVGRHEVTFERQGQDLVVDTRFDLAVDVLFVTAYRYRYEATDTWRDGCLVSLRADVDDDGQRHRVVARLDGGTLQVTGPKAPSSAPLGIFPTHHWNAGVLPSERVLNTITGGIDAVRIVDLGPEPVVVNGQQRTARRYAYTGALQTEVWYDAAGRWVKMRFDGKDGSKIEYLCESCSREQTAER